MANARDKNQQAAPPSRQVSPAAKKSLKKSRLPVMPLAVLLPSLGNLADLQKFAARFERRLQELQIEDANTADDEEGEGQLSRSGEESMLNQVLQWLSVGTEGE